MAFIDYMWLIGPGLKALVNFARCLHEKKADDGKISFAEFWECVGKMGEELFPIVEPIIREEEKKTAQPVG